MGSEGVACGLFRQAKENPTTKDSNFLERTLWVGTFRWVSVSYEMTAPVASPWGGDCSVARVSRSLGCF